MKDFEFNTLVLSLDDEVIQSLHEINVTDINTVKQAKTKEELLYIIMDHNIDLIVLDLNCKLDDILSSLHILRSDDEYSSIPIIAIDKSNLANDLSKTLGENNVLSILTYETYINQIKSSMRFVKNNIISVHRLNNQIDENQKQLITDPLTGASNRRGAVKAYSRLVSFNESNQEEFSLVMLDIDDFKYINDTYGHDIGDQVLIEMSEIITDHIYGHDRLIRFGGEEFIILLSDISAEDSIIKAEHIRELIENHHFTSKDLNITASIGVKDYCEGITLDALIIQSDELMYKAKSSGKNMVCSSETKISNDIVMNITR